MLSNLEGFYGSSVIEQGNLWIQQNLKNLVIYKQYVGKKTLTFCYLIIIVTITLKNFHWFLERYTQCGNSLLFRIYRLRVRLLSIICNQSVFQGKLKFQSSCSAHITQPPKRCDGSNSLFLLLINTHL